MTRAFRYRVCYPVLGAWGILLGGICLLPLPRLVVALIALGVGVIGFRFALGRLLETAYRRLRMDEGNYKYVTYVAPVRWHYRMGCLRLLELLTPRSQLLPLYRRIGARIGEGVVIAGYITEPDLVEIGDNTVVGLQALITPHSIENGTSPGEKQLVLAGIKIGSNCIVGAGSVLLPGVEVVSDATVPAGSAVPKWRHVSLGFTEGKCG